VTGRDQAAYELFRRGCVIPAHPLALTPQRRLDERHQLALSRYYLDAGAGGLAVGVHTTQFAIHDNGMLRPVLEIGAAVARAAARPLVLVAGVQGPTARAVAEAELAAGFGYDLVLLRPERSLDDDDLIDRVRAVGEVLPVVGFYLQPAVGGRRLSRDFWARLVALDAVVGIKVAPFDRYLTLDVLDAVARSGREGEIALYTGNDNHILGDLVTPHRIAAADGEVCVGFVGGLLGQWAMWTREAVRHLELTERARRGDDVALREALALDAALTDANGAIFDAGNGFRGCLPGIHEVLRRQGLLAGTWCLDPDEALSAGQLEEIDRIWGAYPHLRDDSFVAQRLDSWLS
jgi:dihydrodipicolinate synthase/N-acetylneuraminate lyase